MLKKVDTNIWVAEQNLKYWGLEVGTRMTVIRLNNGENIVISPIKVDEETINQINEAGKVTIIIAPNLYHHLSISDFKSIYSDAKIFAAPGLEFKRQDIKFNKILDRGKIGSEDEIEYFLFEGFKILDLKGFSPLNEIVFFHRASRTLILTDTAFHFNESFPLTTQLTMRLIGGYKKLEPSILEKLATREKAKVKNSIQKVLEWDFERVIVAHGSILENEAKDKLKKGYEWALSS
jgi:glyoxylase-like metal-dependent hydrolase (beta-lactamase superfamily II)